MSYAFHGRSAHHHGSDYASLEGFVSESRTMQFVIRSVHSVRLLTVALVLSAAAYTPANEQAAPAATPAPVTTPATAAAVASAAPSTAPSTPAATTPPAAEARRSPVADAPGTEQTKADGIKTREGSEWKNQRGRFTLVGDRVSFTPSDRALNIVVLENLNLERIVRTIEESRTVADADQLEWTIDGVLTEFRGTNFLLLNRSVLVAKPKKSDSVR